MQKTIFLLLIFSGWATAAMACSPSCSHAAAGQNQSPLYSQWMVESQGLQWVNDHDWDYVPGLVAKAVIKAWAQYPEKNEYFDAVKAYADRAIGADGRIKVGESNVDDLAAGKIFFELIQQMQTTGDTVAANKYRFAVDFLRSKLKYEHARIQEPLPGAGVFWHKKIYPNQVWLDGLYMGAAFYAEWQANFAPDDTESWSDIAKQFKIIHPYTYNAGTGLNYHAWSADPADANSFWAKKDKPFKGTSKEFWGRGMGWYFAALADVLECMPQTHPDYPELVRIFNEVAAGLKAHQDANTGLWTQLLQYPAGTVFYAKNYPYLADCDTKFQATDTRENYFESSASSMFACGFLKGLRLGVLDRDVYEPVARRAYQGLIDTFISGQETGTVSINQICLSAGLGPANKPARDGSAEYYLFYDKGREAGDIVSNEGKAIGPFILASLEFERYFLGK